MKSMSFQVTTCGVCVCMCACVCVCERESEREREREREHVHVHTHMQIMKQNLNHDPLKSASEGAILTIAIICLLLGKMRIHMAIKHMPTFAVKAQKK